MNDLSLLDRRLREKKQTAQERARLHQRHMRERMGEIDRYYEDFATIADRVAEQLIRPRMELLASYFDNAEPLPGGDEAHRHHCRYRFGHTERFPATGTLDLAVCPDADSKKVVVLYSLEILPLLFRFDGSDRIEFALDGVDEPRLITWLEEQIGLAFDVLNRVEEAEPYQRDNTVTDPVCGMQINKAWASSRMEYSGETYYFCVEECREKFAGDPQRYARHGGT
ncbi:MAG: YHS domain-containing protein [Isosphaeraceae bacterium]